MPKFFFSWISAFLGRFLTKKQPKLNKNEENWQNPNRLIQFSEIWYVDASQQNKMLHKSFFWISAFCVRFLTKKQTKLTKNEENWLNPNRLVNFLKFGICWIEIWLKTAKIWHNR